MLAIAGAASMVRALLTRKNGVTVEGEVTQVNVTVRNSLLSKRQSFKPVVRFETAESEIIQEYPNEFSYDKYPVGKRPDVIYDPQKPELFYFKKDLSAFTMPLLQIVCGAFVAIWVVNNIL